MPFKECGERKTVSKYVAEIIQDFCAEEGKKRYSVFDQPYLEYLGVSSPLRRSTCNDTPQVTISSSPSAVIGRHVGPFFNVPEPAVPWSPSWSSALQSAFNYRRQDVIFPLDVAVISQFTFLYVIEKLSFSAEPAQYFNVGDMVFPFDLTYLSQTPHFKCLYLVFKDF